MFNTLKLSTMVGENFEICISEIARNALKMFPVVGEKFEICISEMARNGLNTVCPPWLEKIFEICISEMVRNRLKSVHHACGKLLNFISLKWLEMH